MLHIVTKNAGWNLWAFLAAFGCRYTRGLVSNFRRVCKHEFRLEAPAGRRLFHVISRYTVGIWVWFLYEQIDVQLNQVSTLLWPFGGGSSKSRVSKCQSAEETLDLGFGDSAPNWPERSLASPALGGRAMSGTACRSGWWSQADWGRASRGLQANWQRRAQSDGDPGAAANAMGKRQRQWGRGEREQRSR